MQQINANRCNKDISLWIFLRIEIEVMPGEGGRIWRRGGGIWKQSFGNSWRKWPQNGVNDSGILSRYYDFHPWEPMEACKEQRTHKCTVLCQTKYKLNDGGRLGNPEINHISPENIFSSENHIHHSEVVHRRGWQGSNLTLWWESGLKI